MREAQLFFHFQFDEASVDVSKHIDEDQRSDQELFTENTEKVGYCLVSHRDSEIFMLYTTVTWNDIFFKGRRSCSMNAQHASNIKDQTRHFVLVEACYKALPSSTRSRQGNESTVDSSCTSLEITS